MRKLTLFLFAFLFLTSLLNAQNKSVLVYTLNHDAEFIPYLNGRQMAMIPVDSFYINADTLNYIQLTIHFQDKHIADLSKTIGFDMFKHKNYEIVLKSNTLRQIENIGSSNKSDTLYDVFRLKDNSVMRYLKRETSLD